MTQTNNERERVHLLMPKVSNQLKDKEDFHFTLIIRIGKINSDKFNKPQLQEIVFKLRYKI
jgi:hypothetical protein